MATARVRAHLLLAAAGLLSCTQHTTRSPDRARAAVTDFVLEIDPSSATARVTLRGLAVEANLIQNGAAGGPIDSFELVTTNVRLPGAGGCPVGQNCFDVTARSFYDAESFANVYMQIDEIDPPTGRAMANSDGPPLNSGLSSPFGGRNFGTVGPGQAVLREVRITIPGLERYVVRGRLFHDVPVACPSVAACRLFVADGFEPQIYTVDPSTALLTSTITVSMPGFTVTGILGLDSHPYTGQLFGVVKTAPSANARNRYVATIDKTTGVATRLGGLSGDAVGNITFNDDGTILWASIGERSATPTTLKAIDLATGAVGPVITTFGNGDDGEAIGFNRLDGRIYHASGLSDNNRFFESVDPNNGFALDVLSNNVTVDRDEISGLGYNPDNGQLFAVGLSSNLMMISRTASVAVIGLIPKPQTVLRAPTLSP